LFITYIVTSKPKRISVAAGVVHMVLILKGFWLMPLVGLYIQQAIWNISKTMKEVYV
jgi:hypothetical protein